MKKYSLAVLLVTTLSCTHNARISENTVIKHSPEVVVHRGSNRLAPENTMAALKLAIDQGAGYIEVDLATSNDSVLYCFHDKTLERTTNGSGVFSEQNSAYIDKLDAGSWFSPDFKGEKVPRVNEIIKMAKGRAKFYFDVKTATVDQLIRFIRSNGLEEDCFIWFSDRAKAHELKEKAEDLTLKMNATTPAEVESLVAEFTPQIIECNIVSINPELQKICKKNNIKILANLLRDCWWEYKQAVEMNVDMVNIDHPDYYQNILHDVDHNFTAYRLAAHRGGITEGLFDEYDPQSLRAAIDSGYWMLEIDVQPTADKQIIVHHDNNLLRIYGVDKSVNEMALPELKALKAIRGGYSPLTFEEVAQMCSGKIRFMMDVKPGNPDKWFYEELNRILIKYNMLKDAYFIRNDVRSYFAEGKFGFRMQEVYDMKKRLDKGEDISAQYYLFDHGNRINAEVVRWCQQHYIDVCASVNTGHYIMENHAMGY